MASPPSEFGVSCGQFFHTLARCGTEGTASKYYIYAHTLLLRAGFYQPCRHCATRSPGARTRSARSQNLVPNGASSRSTRYAKSSTDPPCGQGHTNNLAVFSGPVNPFGTRQAVGPRKCSLRASDTRLQKIAVVLEKLLRFVWE